MKFLPAFLSGTLLLAAGHQAQASLVAWYPFNEGSGAVANDASGNGNFLAATATWLPTGAFGGSAQLAPGQTFLARTGTAGSLTGLRATTGNKISISFWLKPNAENIGENPFYIGDSASAAGNRLFSTHLEWYDGNTYWDVAWGDGTEQRVAGNLGTVADALHHYVMTYNGDSGLTEVYKDGAALISGNTAPQATLPWANINNLELGAASFVAWWPGGQIDDFAIFNHVLSASEINTARTAGIAALVPEPSGCVLLGMTGLLALRRRRKVA